MKGKVTFFEVKIYFEDKSFKFVLNYEIAHFEDKIVNHNHAS